MGSLVYSANDYIKPTILHQIVEEVFEGQALIIEAVVMDNVDVRDVLVYYRVKGEKVFKYEPMSLEFNNYQFEIPSEDVGPYGIEYYLLATDDANNIASLPDFNPKDNAYFIEYVRFSETSAPDVLLMQPDDGEIYDPKNGKTYSGTINIVSKNRLNLRGYVGISWFGRTSHWTRKTK